MNDVAAAQAAATFETFYRSGFDAWVSRVAFRLGGDRDAAADIVQSSMAELWSVWRTCDDLDRENPGIENPDGWLYLACHRKVLKRWRGRSRIPDPVALDDGDVPLWVSSSPDPADVLIVAADLEEIVRRLDPQELAVFRQIAAGWPIASIAGSKATAAHLRALVKNARQRLSVPASVSWSEESRPGEVLSRCGLELARLPGRQRQVAELALRGVKPIQIGRELGISANNARVNLHHATSALARVAGVPEQEIVAAIGSQRIAARRKRADGASRMDRVDNVMDRFFVEPAVAVRAAEAVLAECDTDEEAAIALRLLGLAARQDGQLRRSAALLHRAIRVAERAGAPYRAAEARMSLVVILADLGDTGAALAAADAAEAVLTGTDTARLRVNLAIVLVRCGRQAEARTALEQARPVLSEAGDARWEVLLLNTSGTLHAATGHLKAAIADLSHAAELTESNGYHQLNAMVRGNLGYAAGLAGDFPSALAHLDKAAKAQAVLGTDGTNLRVDRARILLEAGLAAEARQVIEEAITDAEHRGFRYNLAEYRLMHARAALADGDGDTAAASAKAARAMFGRQRRAGWADAALRVELQARFADGERSQALLRQAGELADRLRDAGSATAWPEIRLLAGRVAADRGRDAQARELLADVARHRNHGAAEIRALAWHAHALHELNAGRPWHADRALRAGLRVHEEHAGLGAAELGTSTAAHEGQLANLGLRMAMARPDDAAVLYWVEAARATVLRRRPLRPPEDRQTADDLAALRHTAAQIAEAHRSSRNLSRGELSRLNAERIRLEQAVRDRARQVRGTCVPELPFAPRALASALGDRALVEFVRLEDDLFALTVVGQTVRRHRLGSYSTVLRSLEMLRFTTNRMARRFATAKIQKAAVTAFEHSRGELDASLLAPLRATLDDRDLVLVPTGSLHALPWTVLATCTGRPVSVAPSARQWMSAARGSGPSPSTGDEKPAVLVAGPDLRHAGSEIAALAAVHRTARVLAGADATAGTVAAALDGAHTAHLATSGRFRADQPQFSTLEVADGPLYVYDLQRLRSAPQLLILSAAETALSGARPGDELMGLANTLLALGGRTLIASVTPVEDTDTRTLMLALHERLARGLAPAAALSQASRDTGIHGFACFGFGG